MSPTLFERLQQRLRSSAEAEGIRYSASLKVVILGGTVLLCGLFFPGWVEGLLPQQQRLLKAAPGERWQGPPIVAEYTFVVQKPAEVYEREQQQAAEGILPIFSRRPYQRQELEQRLSSLLDSLEQGMLPLSPEIAEMWTEVPPVWRTEELKRLRQGLETVLSELVRRGDILNVPKNGLSSSRIALRPSPVVETVLPLEAVMDSAEALLMLATLIRQQIAPEQQPIAFELARRLIRPTLFYEAELTEMLRRTARQAVPRTWGIVRAGELIVAPGEPLTDTTRAKLRSYVNVGLLHREARVSFSTLMGSFGHAALVCSVLFVYLGFLRPRIFRDNLQLAGLALGLVSIAALAWASQAVASRLPLQYLIVLPVFSMVVAILLDSRTAFYTTVTAALLVAGVRQGDYPTALALMLGGMLAAYTVRDLESSRQLFRSFFFTLLGMGTAVLVFGVAHGHSVEEVALQCGFVGLNAALSPACTFGILLFLERVFNIVTDMRLLEYSSLEHPLLEELQRKAPGTYQHSLTVARLAEHAARAIGARTLLVRVGAYFHDIGKLTKPEYFAENQIGLDNKHDRLPPKKSAAIIREHVSEGIELARAYGLPQQIIDFIPQHHGTMLIRVFWQKALEQARARQEALPQEQDFRYPGPKPQTKEAAILMLADAAEALTHVIPADEPERLAAALDEVVRERILDGQLEECPLTFRELSRVREALLEGMVGIQHRRVAYGPISAGAEASG